MGKAIASGHKIDEDAVSRIRNIFIVIICLVPSMLPLTAQEADSAVSTDAIIPDNDGPSASGQSELDYLNHISELEKSQGPYGQQVGEQLLGLGLLYRMQEEYDKATEVLNRSLHIKKVNEGIQSMAQVPILQALIQTNTAAENWDELNRNYHLLLWLYQRNYEPGDPRTLPIFEAAGRWKLWAYTNKVLSEELSTTLSDLAEMSKSSFDIMEDMYGENDPRLIVPLKVQAMARYLYLQQAANTPLNDFQGFEQRSTFVQRERVICRVVGYTPAGVPITICDVIPVVDEIPNPGYYTSKQHEKNLSVASHMHSVKGVLTKINRISTANPSIPAIERAISLVNLGDWYFINNQKNTAFENYGQAYQILVNEEGGQAYIDKLFGEPAQLPSMILSSEDIERESDNDPQDPFVKLSFDVNTQGRPRKVKIIEESDPDNIIARKIAKASVKNSLFRPRLLDGAPVDTEQTTITLSGAMLADRSILNNSPQTGDNYYGSRIRR